MASQFELDSTYMGTAFLHARMSKARRKKVGAVIVTASGVTITGFNGTPPKKDNNCEYEVETENGIVLVTKPDVIHAELNCVLKAAKEGISIEGAQVYVTLSPCVPCASMLISAGISRLIYAEKYRDTSGVDSLIESGISVDFFENDVDCSSII